MDKKLQCDKEVIKSLFSLLPLYLYIYTRRPSLLSHTGAVAQWRAMVAVAAMVPLTLISYPHMYIEYIRCASAVAQGRAMAAVDAMVPLTLDNLCCRASGCLCVLEQKSQQICFATGHGCQTEGKAAMQ